MTHPLAHTPNVVEMLDALVGGGIMSCSHGLYTVYDRDESRPIVNETRHVRGVLAIDGRLANLPLPDMKEVAPFHDDIHTYHALIASELPEKPAYVMPRYEGACIHAVCIGTTRITHTRVGFDCDNVRAAELILGDARWEVGITLAFVLTGVTRLHIIYGADARTGQQLDYATLQSLAEKLDIPLVKRQIVKTKKRVMDIVRTVDDVDAIGQVKQGVVLVDASGSRLAIRSWHHHRFSRCTMPSRRWLLELVRAAPSMQVLHDAVETVDGPLDAAVVARRMLVDLILHARASDDGREDDALPILLKHLDAIGE